VSIGDSRERHIGDVPGAAGFLVAAAGDAPVAGGVFGVVAFVGDEAGAAAGAVLAGVVAGAAAGADMPSG